MQIPCGVHPEIPAQGALWDATQAPWEMFRALARQRECEIGEGHLMSDHVHMLISIPPKYSVSQVMGYMKGKSAIQIARTYGGKRRNFVAQHFWARGYWVSTVGHELEKIKKYIQEQEEEEKRQN